MKSVFSFSHPAVIVSYYTGLIILSMTLLHPFFLVTAVLLLFILNSVHGTGAVMRKMLGGSLLLAVIIAVANPLLTHRGSTILFYLSDNPITLESIIYGCTMGLSFLTVALIFISYNAIMSSHKFLYVFSRISPKIALLTMIAVRFVPLFIRRLVHIQLVQKTKGVQTETGSLKKRAQNGMKLLSVLLVCSLEEALQTADSMQARGFGTMKRSTYIRYRMMRRDWSIVLGIVLLFFISIVAVSNGAGILVIYPKLESLQFASLDWLAYVAFFLYISIPLLLEGREWIWWRIQK